jgi:hypothetical protein
LAARRRPSRKYLLDVALLALVALALFLGPRLIDARSALLWTRHYAALEPPFARPADVARGAGRSAARAVERGAPLPWAAEAARNAIDCGRALGEEDPGAALALYGAVRSALDGARSSRLRGLGLGALADEVRALEESARPRAEPSPPLP